MGLGFLSCLSTCSQERLSVVYTFNHMGNAILQLLAIAWQRLKELKTYVASDTETTLKQL